MRSDKELEKDQMKEKTEHMCKKMKKEDLLLYAVTDRHWLNGETLYSQVEKTLEGGTTFVQLREKELDEAYDCVDRNEFEKSIETAIESLSPKCKTVFKLSRYSRMSYTQIAEQEGISQKMVEKHISVALKKIKAHILKSMFLWIIFFSYVEKNT